MRNYFILVVFAALSCFACKSDSTENTKISNAKPSSNKTQSVNNATPAPVKTESPLASLKGMKDKTASQIKLWQNKDISGRLEKLMGADYAVMKKFWNVETPMEVEGNVLQLSGCEQHNCGDNQYTMFIDTANDNINVFHIAEGKLKPYKEKGEIKLPKKFADEFETDKSNLEVK